MTGLYAVDNADELAPVSNTDAATETNLSEKLTAWAHSIKGPLHCTACQLHVRMTDKTVVCRLTSTYHVRSVSERRFAHIFPISRCSTAVDSLSVRINKRPVVGQLVWVRSGSSTQSLWLDTAAPVSPDAFLKEGKQRPMEVYSVTTDASHVLDGRVAEVGAEVTVEIQWTSKEMRWSASHALQFSYSFACAPRLPSAVVCRAVFLSSVRMVRSPNCRHGLGALDWRVRRNRCRVWLTPENAARTLRREDSAFFLVFYFHTPLSVDFPRGFFAPVALVVILGIVVWMLLTKDLID